MKDYLKILRDHEIKVTHHRLEILKYLDEHRIHPTADMIYSELKKSNPSLSRTTIYNSLDTLKEHNIIQVLTISESELRYDIKTTMHHHFLCKRCGIIIDIDIECPNLGKMLNDGHKVEEVHGYFKGTCSECLQNEEDAVKEGL